MKEIYIRHLKELSEDDLIDCGVDSFVKFEVLNSDLIVIDRYDFINIPEGLRIDVKIINGEQLTRIWSPYGDITYDITFHTVELTEESSDRFKRAREWEEKIKQDIRKIM